MSLNTRWLKNTQQVTAESIKPVTVDPPSSVVAGETEPLVQGCRRPKPEGYFHQKLVTRVATNIGNGYIVIDNW